MSDNSPTKSPETAILERMTPWRISTILTQDRPQDIIDTKLMEIFGDIAGVNADIVRSTCVSAIIEGAKR